MRLPRMTTRRLMAIVAAVAIVLGLGIEVSRLRQLWEEYSDRARLYAGQERDARGFLGDVSWLIPRLSQSPPDRVYRTVLESRAAEQRRILPFITAMRKKYERAARYPWLPVAPDPPPPR